MKRISLTPPAKIHLIGICGTGMGALAGLLKARGFAVTGSDAQAYPPMSTELEAQGIRIMEGYHARNLDHAPDLVVVGNVCKVDHPEAKAARERGLACVSMPAAVRDLLLPGRRSLVVAGTHGKTTTTAMLAFLLERTGRDPSLLVGGVTADFGAGHKLGGGDHFVIEGDEYDSAYFEKRPKFLSYEPAAAIITSVEHDHVDIYPTEEAYRAAFVQLAALVDPGPLVVFAGDRVAVEVARFASARVVTYAAAGDECAAAPDWIGADLGGGRFALTVEGRAEGEWLAPMPGRHNLRNTVAALAMANLAAGIPLDELGRALPAFGGVARRQQVVASPRGIVIYDDFAHHPTAVRETLAALSGRHAAGRLAAAFEPRSATACRRVHQAAYAAAFDAAGLVLIAPVGRALRAEEMLDTGLLARDLRERGIDACAAGSVEEIIERIAAWARPGDGVALLSNGAFGGVHRRLAEALS
jgi:UDP-N-acetylmuramate: L-alanyl-gamma-D-glutamyl-meso-diaminopimelate ligase